MKYVSTTGTKVTDLEGAVARCFAPDGSLFLPERVPVVPRAVFNNIEGMTLVEIAYIVVTSLLGDDVNHIVLKKVVDETFTFDIPVDNLEPGIDIARLYDGPTMAFKDFSARFVANFVKLNTSESLPRVALVATTGNTGAAIANAFRRHKDRHVVVLYPRGVLNRYQIRQLTTIGDNIHPLEVVGDIGRCKQMVRDTLADESLRSRMKLLSLNTTNFLRLVPQVVFYFFVYSRIKAIYGSADAFVPSIPCGNLSSLTSAVIAKKMGLPVGKIVAGCNANDDLVRLLKGELPIEKINTSSRPTLARAMDSGFPTNLRRLLKLYNNDIKAVGGDITAVSVSDEEIVEIINDVLQKTGQFVDPHTAVSIGALKKSIDTASKKGVAFATAHPAKSLDIMTAITGRAIELPVQMNSFMAQGIAPVKIPPTYPALKKYLLNNINPK